MAQRRKKPPAKRRRAKRRQSKRRGLWLGLAGVLGTLLLGLAGLLVWAVLPGPGAGKAVSLSWPAAELGPRATGARLADAGLVRSPRLMAAYLALLPLELDPGPHLVNDALSPRELVQRMARVPGRPTVRVTVPEGWHHLQIAGRLERLEVCSAAAFERAVRRRDLLSDLGIPGKTAEGFLFPATYELALDSDPRRVVRAMVAQLKERVAVLQKRHPGALERLAEARGWGLHEILTLASMVEKEAARAEERPLIASVFFNRLSDPDFRPLQTLQSDPTSGYGCIVAPADAPSCAGYSGKITPAMNRDVLNRYNTYAHAGLPPGPIANPGADAIEAVLKPADSDFLFFYARGDGRHVFSRSFDEHQREIDKRRRRK